MTTYAPPENPVNSSAGVLNPRPGGAMHLTLWRPYQDQPGNARTGQRPWEALAEQERWRSRGARCHGECRSPKYTPIPGHEGEVDAPGHLFASSQVTDFRKNSGRVSLLFASSRTSRSALRWNRIRVSIVNRVTRSTRAAIRDSPALTMIRSPARKPGPRGPQPPQGRSLM